MSYEILQGLTTFTVVIIKNRAETVKALGEMNPQAGKAHGYIVTAEGRILVSTDAEFETAQGAADHMQKVIEACVEWGKAGMPKIHDINPTST